MQLYVNRDPRRSSGNEDSRQYLSNNSNQQDKSIFGTAVLAVVVCQPQSVKQRQLWTRPRHR